MTSKFFIYGLSDPRTGSIRYIGKSCSGMQRPRQHSTPKKLEKDFTHKGNWIRLLINIGLKPNIEIIEEFDTSDMLYYAEIFWISQFRAWDFDLTNSTDGGDGFSPGNTYRRGIIQTSEEKQARSEGMKKAWQEKDWSKRNAKVSQSMLGNTNGRFTKGILKGPMSEENRKKISDANKGKLKKPEISTSTILALYNSGMTRNAIARELRIDKMTVKKRLLSIGAING